MTNPPGQNPNPPKDYFGQLVDTIKNYKEIIGGIVAIIAGIYAVADYFATKFEVSVLQCQMQNNIQLVNSDMKGDQIMRKISGFKIGSAGALSPATGIEVERLKQELLRNDDDRREAAKRLVPGACEKIVRGK